MTPFKSVTESIVHVTLFILSWIVVH